MTRLDVYIWRIDVRNTCARDVEIGDTFTDSTFLIDAYPRVIYLGNNCIGGTSAGGVCVKGIFTRDAEIGNVEIEDTRIGNASIPGTRYVGGVGTFKDLGIHLQWSRILELKQYRLALETRVAAGWWSL